MTTIAAKVCKEGGQIASDLQATHSGGLKFKLKTKILEFSQPLIWPTKFYLGLCGDLDSFSDVISYLTDPTDFKRAPRGTGGDFLVLTGDKKLFTFKSPAKWMAIDSPFYAVGTGMNYAMSAMDCGKTALQAVKVASKYDIYTGMGFKSFDLK